MATTTGCPTTTPSCRGRIFPPISPRPSRGAGIDRTVLVQAAATVEETDYMLGLADATPTVGAVVGWVDFEDARVSETLTRLASASRSSAASAR